MRSALLVAAGITACAGGDGLGPVSNPSPYYGTASVGDGGDDDDDASTGEADDAADDDGAPPPDDPTADAPPPPDPTDAGDEGANDDGAPMPPPMPPPMQGDCCTPTGQPGCAADPAVEACVCDLADFCCLEGWDETCVFIVGECAEVCPGQQPPDGGGDSNCCAPTGMPGCDDPEIAGCVCAEDAFCCLVEWDDLCAELAFDCGC